MYIQWGNPTNSGKGIASLEEPTHTDLQPRLESDGYIWKYLYTIKPSDIAKFDSVDYIPVPQDWLNNPDTLDIRNAAVDGKIETVVIEYILCCLSIQWYKIMFQSEEMDKTD